MKCFGIIPHRDPFPRIYDTVIVPAARECGLDCTRADTDHYTGEVFAYIKQAIGTSRLCIADLSGRNPNVMLEVAIALSVNVPVILITQGEFNEIPFDIRHHRVIRYDTSPEQLTRLREEIAATIRTTLKLGGSPTEFLRQMLTPASLSHANGPYVVAASPLSYREAFRVGSGWLERPVGTFSDHLGIRGLMQAFGLIYGLDRLPELLNPDDFDDKVLATPMHLYCIASPKANRWTGMMLKRFFEDRRPVWEFRPDPESPSLRNPMVSIYRDGKPHEPTYSVPGGRLVWDFGLVIRGPHPNDSGRLLMVLAGRSSLGTEAACLGVTSPPCVEKLVAALTAAKVDLDDHAKAFCAVVSVSAKDQKPRLGAEPGQFQVAGVQAY